MAEHLSHDVLLMLGVGLFGGLCGGWLLKRARVPQVVGYIGVGVLIGASGLRLIGAADADLLEPFTLFALAVIGLLVGGELKLEEFRKYGKQFVVIMLSEGLLAFAMVAVGTALLMWLISGSLVIGAVCGIVLGAIAAATDPPSTISVLWEYRTAGPLTSTLTAIVALDDALALTLYALGTSVARMLTLGSTSTLGSVATAFGELGLAAALGTLFAGGLLLVVFRARESHVAAAAALGVALLLVEAAHSLGADVILVSMVCGFVVRNASGDRCENLFKMLRQFSLPVMVVFFVLVGAQLQVSAVPLWLIGLVAVYVLARSAGKVAGAYLGGWASRSAASVRRYAGMGLFTQGAVAVGLSIMAVHRLGEQPAASGLRLGEVIIFCATATTLVVEIIGPPLVKLAAGLAGEIGRNVTEEDVILSWSVADVTDTDLVTVREGDSLQRVFGLFSTHDYLLIPVVGAAGELIGIVSMSVLKHILADHQMWEWLLVSDVMEPAEHTARPSQRLEDALKQMDLMALEQMPVVQEADGARPVGVLSLARVRRLVRQEALRRQQPAEPPRPAPAGAGAEGPPTPRPR